jgi:hypothetical protein
LTPDYRVLNSYSMNNSNKYFGGGGYHFALIEQFKCRKVNIFSIIIASYF